MRRKSKCLARPLALLLALMLLMSVLPIMAAEPVAADKSYDIAVVFDNSASMYRTKGWCRAKYAMEIFASMLDYAGGDKLQIFPMWEVVTDGSQPTSGGSYLPYSVGSKEEIDKISNMFTIYREGTGNTPFAPATEAFNYMKTSKADEKWIIVLSDGEFNEDSRGFSADLSGNNLRKRLLELTKNDIHVQYLGFDRATDLQSEPSKGFYAKSSTDTSLMNDLIEICNTIFQRSELPKDRLNGTALNLDLSMRKLIVFVQGDGAKIDSLTDSNGNTISVTMNSGQRKYSQVKAYYAYEDFAGAPVDDTLYGQVVTFGACPKGSYTLNYSGASADKIQIFYEPDVDLKVSLINSEGMEIENAESLSVGEYTVNAKLVDAVTGEDVTSHPLMGGNVDIQVKIKKSTDVGEQTYGNHATITLTEDSDTQINVEATYLEKYKISSKDDPNTAWMSSVQIVDPTPAFRIKATVLQPNSWYTLMYHEDWKAIRYTMSVDGMPLTDEHINALSYKITTNRDITYYYKTVPGQSAIDVFIGYTEDGTYMEPSTGGYEMTLSTTYVDEKGQDAPGSATASFKIRRYTFGTWILIVLAAIALLIGLIVAWMKHPTYPKKMTLHEARGKGYEEEGIRQDLRGSFTLDADGYTIFSGKAKRYSAWTKRNGTGAKVKITDIEPDGEITNLRIGGEKINKDCKQVILSDMDQIKFQKGAHKIEKRFQIRINQ